MTFSPGLPRLLTFITSVLLVACSPTTNERIDVISRSVCVVGVNGLSYSVITVEDFSYGKISVGSEAESIDYYIGSHPDDSGVVFREPLKLETYPGSGAEVQRYEDGTLTISVIPAGRPADRRDIMLFGKSKDLVMDKTIKAVVGRVRWCAVTAKGFDRAATE